MADGAASNGHPAGRTLSKWSGHVHHRWSAGEGQHDYSLDYPDESKSNYLRWIVNLCAPYLGQSILDVGAGYGAITTHLVDGRTVTALDASPACATALRARFAGMSQVRVIEGDLGALGDERYDSILLTNVLEHIQDDRGFLMALEQHLLPGGNIVIYVPALNGLYTAWDRRVGHYRRYSKRRLRGVAAEAGLAVTHMRYANLVSIPAWTVSGRMVDRDSQTMQSLKAWDRVMIPISQAIEARVAPPIGLNLLCVLQPAR